MKEGRRVVHYGPGWRLGAVLLAVLDMGAVCVRDGVVFGEMLSLERLIKWKYIERATHSSMAGQGQREGWKKWSGGVKHNFVYQF